MCVDKNCPSVSWGPVIFQWVKGRHRRKTDGANKNWFEKILVLNFFLKVMSDLFICYDDNLPHFFLISKGYNTVITTKQVKTRELKGIH